MPPEIFENTSEPGMGAESDRPKRRRPVSSVKRRWLPEELALLGKVTDSEAAEKLKRTRSSVTSQRCALGIARLPGKALWAAEEIDLLGTVPDEEAGRRLGRLLGTMPDAELGRQIGRSTVAVRKRRLRLKVECSAVD
jgi:hypothetical protein